MALVFVYNKLVETEVKGMIGVKLVQQNVQTIYHAYDKATFHILTAISFHIELGSVIVDTSKTFTIALKALQAV